MTAETVAAQGFDIGLTTKAPPYATANSNISFEMTLENLTNKNITDIGVFAPIPANTTYVSGGDFIEGDGGVEFKLASLASGAKHTFTLIIKVDNGTAPDTVIENSNTEIYMYTISGTKTDVNEIELEPQDQFEFTVSPDGDHISFDATEDIAAPEIYIAHDPIHPGDPSVIFDIEGVLLWQVKRSHSISIPC